MPGRDGDEVDESTWADATWASRRPPARRRRRRFTRRVVRAVNRLSELPLPLTVGALLAIGLGLSFTYMHFCL